MATILTKLRVLQPELKKGYAIRKMGVFGSYVRGQQREDSVLVDLGDGMTLIDLEISDALGLKVDLAMKDALKPRIEKRILAEAVML